MDFTDQFERVKWAEHRGAELSSEIQAWASGEPWRCEAIIAEDRLSWELVLRVLQQPPLGEWSLRFGEAAHHLRAMLDNLVLAIARQTGVTDAKELKRIQFPICASEKEWKDNKDRVRSLPGKYQDAVANLQPFQRIKNGGKVDEDLLLVLRDTDNADKHHLQVKSTLRLNSIEHQPSVEFETEEGADASVPPTVEIFAPDLEDGALLLCQTTQGRIAKVRGSFDIGMTVQLVLPNGNPAGVTVTLAGLCRYTNTVLNSIVSV